jgi:hypothetical protein
VTDVVSNPSLIVFRCVFSGASEEIPLGEDKQPTPSPVLIITPPPPFAVIKYHAYGCFKMLAALIFGIDLRTSDLEGARDRDDDPIDFDRLARVANVEPVLTMPRRSSRLAGLPPSTTAPQTEKVATEQQ